MQEDRILKVAVGVPSAMNLWVGDMGMSLCRLVAHFAQVPVFEGIKHKLSLIHVKGSVLPKSRADMVRRALEAKADYLFMVDCDQAFPPDTLHRLLRHNKDVVAANVAVKKFPSGWTARSRSSAVRGGLPVNTKWKSTGLQQVWRIGTGVILFKMDVFRKLGISHFNIHYRPEIDDYQGEDWSLMERLEREGIPIWIDHDLSKEILHYGWHEYSIHDIEEQEEADTGWWGKEARG